MAIDHPLFAAGRTNPSLFVIYTWPAPYHCDERHSARAGARHPAPNCNDLDAAGATK
jgi:hypothetical protein